MSRGAILGSSPLTRGKPASGPAFGQYPGLIPAHAGKTQGTTLLQRTAEAHPRSRGENLKQIARDVNKSGSSPLTREKPEADRARREQVRLIPAHAGKTCRSRCSLFSPCGSSPLTRGKRGAEARPPGGDGLIPAHAGKTSAVCCATVSVEAHPRSRGENHSHGVLEAEAQGSSPLTRGKRGAVDGGRDGLRLIPAHAGKTQATRRRHQRPRAHPRSRGENSVPFLTRIMDGGSSPLTRGKRGRQSRGPVAAGLISAHAGKTSCPSRPDDGRPAHPRSRGENTSSRSHIL